MGEKILPRNIDLIESEFLTSKGGLKLKMLALATLEGVDEIATFQYLRSKLFRLILREIKFLTLPKDKTLLVLSAFGPLVNPRCVTYLYFQNVALLESTSLKARLFKLYLKKFQTWDNCFVVIQSNWIMEKYAIFNAKKVIVHPFREMPTGQLKYLFYPTSANKYKNNESLIRTFSSIETSLLLLLTIDSQEIELKKFASNIRCIGSVDPFVMGQLYKNAEAVLLCSDYESYSYPLYESQTYNKLIIAKEADYLTAESENIKKFENWDELKIIIEDLCFSRENLSN